MPYQPRRIPLSLHDKAIDAFLKRDFTSFFGYASSDVSVDLYFNNQNNLYCGYNSEEAFLEMWSNQKRGLGGIIPLEEIHFKLLVFSKRILRTAGDPIPAGERFTLFRGVNGAVPESQFGISWTSDLPLACWFAVQFNRDHENNVPTVYTIEIRRREICAYLNESARNESEYLIFPKKPKRLDLSNEEMERLSDKHLVDRKEELDVNERKDD